MINDIAQFTVFGIQLINFHNFGYLIMKLAMDIIFILIIIRYIFYPAHRETNYVFTAILINIAVFLICFLLGSIKLKIGFAFGLFAVFSIIRYRTEQIPIRKMTYLFTAIIVAVLNALSDENISYAELILANLAIVITIVFLEKNIFVDREITRIITYEKIDLIKPQKYKELIADLRERTGLDILKADIETVNFLNDTAKLKILYKCPGTGEENE